MKLYCVLKNERLCDIARKLDVTIQELCLWNGITNVDVIEEGDLLEIPSKGVFEV